MKTQYSIYITNDIFYGITFVRGFDGHDLLSVSVFSWMKRAHLHPRYKLDKW